MIIGYLLNVFDLDSDKKVKDNIILPFKEGFEKENLDNILSIPVYAYNKLNKE